MPLYHKEFNYYLRMFENPGNWDHVIPFGFKLSLGKKFSSPHFKSRENLKETNPASKIKDKVLLM